MKMRNFLTSAFVVTSLCVASVAMADLARVNIVMDISDPDNVTLTNYEENGTYGGQWFVIDALEFHGAVADVDFTIYSPGGPAAGPHDLPFGVSWADGNMVSMWGYCWMEYGYYYNMLCILDVYADIYYNKGNLVVSSDPDDFYAVYADDIYPRSFLIADASDQNGFGTVLLGTIVPEPASMSLLVVGTLAIIRRRRR